MAVAGWYDDPTRTGRRRYWDGDSWTSYVSDGGPTTNDPVPDPAPPPPGEAPAPRAGAPAAAGGQYPATVLGRAGFAVAALGGVLVATTAGSTVAEQEDTFTRIEVAGGAWVGVVAAILCIAAAAAPWPWARITGVGISSFFAIIVAFAVIGFRTTDDFVPDIDVTLGPAGWLMVAGSLLLFAGTALALIGLRRPARGPDPSLRPKDGKAVASLVLGIVGVLVPVTAAPAVGLGLFAMDDVRVSDGRVGGRGMAVAGFVLGIVSLSLWGLGLLLGMLFAQP